MLLSFQLLPEQPASELLDAVVVADRLGYYGCFSADEIYHKDAWLLFAAAAKRTQRIRLGPCVAPIYMRDPTYVAQLAATLDELSGGRAEVVFGIGNIAMLKQYGVEWRGTRPIARLREAHQVMRTLLDDGAIDFAGDFYRYTGVTTAARPVQEHLPLKIGAMGGPKSMQLAGEIADGLHTACATHPRRWATRPSTFGSGSSAPPGHSPGWTSATHCSGRSRRMVMLPVVPGEFWRPSTSRRCLRHCSNGMGSNRT
jgi:5,10-methylenetetrahydromethanopterin reductase